MKSQLIVKDSDAGKDWGQEEKGTTANETVGWHHRLNRHAFEQTPGHSEEQGSLACCSPWGHKESDTTEWLNNNRKKWSTDTCYSVNEPWKFMLSERSQIQKTTYWVVPFMWDGQRIGKSIEMNDCLGLGERGMGSKFLRGTGLFGELIKCFGISGDGCTTW